MATFNGNIRFPKVSQLYIYIYLFIYVCVQYYAVIKI